MTGGVHDDKGSIAKHDDRTNMLVTRAADALANKYRAKYTSIINEAWFFGLFMDHSLINLDQVWHFATPT